MDRKFILAIFIISLSFLEGYLIIQNQPRQKLEKPKEVNIPESVTPELKPSKYSYPISGYHRRITYRYFGKNVTASDHSPDCGRTYVGFHNGDDLEVTTEENNKDVEIKAISNGTIVLAENIDGYGGLIIEKTEIEGQKYLINYGHIRISSATVSVGTQVNSGQKLALLGNGCSTETDGERKHLHFSIHKGDTIDVRGYIPTEEELKENWVNPKYFLEKINAG